MLKYAEFVKAAQVTAYDEADAPFTLPDPPARPLPPPPPRKPTWKEIISDTYWKSDTAAGKWIRNVGQKVRQALEQADKQVQKWPEPREKYQNILDTIRDRYRRVKGALKPQGVPAAPQK